MWITPSNKAELEQALFDFLQGVRDGQPSPTRPLAAGRDTLAALYAHPCALLRQALRHCLDAFLVELGPDPAAWGVVRGPVETLGLALAANNLLAGAGRATSDMNRETPPPDDPGDFTAALVAALPPARDRDAALAYHAVLRAARPSPSGPIGHALLERSPITALCALDLHTPAALEPLAVELLPGWPADGPREGDVWAGPDEWLDAVAALLGDARLARWLRHRWLALPENRPACRNLGLLLEALRRRGAHRDLILQFYEAYDLLRGETRRDRWGNPVRVWPVLETTEQLLRASGDDETALAAALHLNRRGNEYLLKFRALIETVIAEGGLPTDYAHLSRELLLALRALLPYVTAGAQQRLTFGEIRFGGDDVKREA